MAPITVVGGGLAGLVAAITAAEAGAPVRLIEAHEELGGRARSSSPPYVANLGPHAMYKDGALWTWLRERDLLPRTARPPLAPIRVRWDAELRRTPPLASIPAVLRLRGRDAPVDRSFRDWVADHADERTAAILSASAGVFTFHHDPGSLSAAFVWQRAKRALLTVPPPARWPIGGWGTLVRCLEERVRALGVEVATERRVDVLPEPPVIVATELSEARTLLGDESLDQLSGRTVCLDLGLEQRRGDPWVVSDLDEAGWVERFSAADRSLAPEGKELVQAQMPIRPGEPIDAANARLETLLDQSFESWRDRVTWRRRQVMDGRTGALDLPGLTWRDRPRIDRGDGVLLAGDMVGAPGLLGEVAATSGRQAAERALAYASRDASGLRSVA
jgi:phytoene dehydrogenase-like protein